MEELKYFLSKNDGPSFNMLKNKLISLLLRLQDNPDNRMQLLKELQCNELKEGNENQEAEQSFMSTDDGDSTINNSSFLDSGDYNFSARNLPHYAVNSVATASTDSDLTGFDSSESIVHPSSVDDMNVEYP